MKRSGWKSPTGFMFGLMAMASSASTFTFATPLTDAVDEGNLKEVKRLVASGVNINEIEPIESADNLAGAAPLQVAVMNGSIEIADYLLKNGADVSLRTDWGMAQHIAAFRGNLEMLMLLAENGANLDALNAENEAGATALQHALSNNFYADTAMWLVKKGAAVKDFTLDENGYSDDHPLLLASQWLSYDETRDEAEELLKLMFDNNVELSFATEYGYGFQWVLELADEDLAKEVVERVSGQGALNAALFSSLEYGLAKAAEEAMDRGAYLTATVASGANQGATALQLAIAGGLLGIAEELLEEGVDPNYRGTVDPQGYSALDYPLALAISRLEYSEDADEIWDLIWVLDERGAAWDVVNSEGDALVFMLFGAADDAAIKDFVSSRDTPAVVDSFGNSPLATLIKTGKSESALAYAKRYADRPLHTDQIGFHELHLAYRAGMVDLARRLASREGGITAIDPFGRTVLHSAYAKGDPGFIQGLGLDEGVLNAKDKRGNTLLHLAIRDNDVEFARWLVEQGADANLLNDDKQSPLSQYLDSGLDGFEFLLDQAKKETQYPDGSLLHIALRNNNTRAVEQLIRKGFDLNAKNGLGYSPAQFAIVHGSRDSLEVLLSHTEEPERQPGQYGFDDPLLAYWVSLFYADRKQEMLASVEQHLGAVDDAPLMSYIWAVTNLSYLDLDPSDVLARARTFGRKLAVVLDVVLLKGKAEYAELLKKYPPSYPFVKSDLFALVELADAAKQVGDIPTRYAYLNAAIRLEPNTWQLAWMYDDMHALNNGDIRQGAKALAAAPELAGSLAGQFLKQRLAYRNWYAADRLYAAREWLQASPNDPRALTSASYSYESMRFLEQSKDAVLRAMAIFPFYANHTQAVESLIRLRDFDQARGFSNIIATRFEDENEPLGARAARYYSESLRLAGERGRARAELELALKQWPRDGRLLREMGRLESAEGRHEQALSFFEKSIQGNLDEHEKPYIDYLGELVSLGRYDRAAEYGSILHRRGVLFSVSDWKNVLSAARKAEDHQQFEQILAAAKQTFPRALELREEEVEWLKARDPESALARVEQLVSERPSEYEALWKSVASEHLTDDQYGWHLGQMRESYPWSAGWYYFGSGDTDEEEVRRSWSLAMKNPELGLLGCKNVINSLTRDGQFTQALETFDACDESVAAADTYLASQRHHLLEAYFYLVLKWSEQERLNPRLIDQSLALLNDYKHRFGNQSTYHDYREVVFRLKGDDQQAAESVRQRALLDQDNSYLSWVMVKYYQSELSRRFVWGYINNLIERQPFNETMMSGYLNRHLLWGGSAVNALRAIEAAKARGVSVNPEWSNRAYSALGDSLKGFDSYSKGITKPGASKFYINWFESFRKAALTADPKEIRYDFSSGYSQVEIIYPNGEVVTRRDHALISRPVLFTKGAARAEIHYDEEGRWMGISQPGGESISLEYDAEGRITRLVEPDSSVTELAYNEQGKPILIDVLGVGSVSVDYDSNGEVRRVHSEQGHQMAMRITQTFQRLMSHARMAGQMHDMDAVSAMLQTDDRVLGTLRNAMESEPYQSSDWYAAYNRLVTHLVENVTSNAGYFDEASERLVSFFQQESRTLSRSNLPHLVRTIELWHDLYQQMRPYGLDQSAFSIWTGMRNWLIGASFNYDEYKAVLERLDRNPLALLTSAQWLHKSELSNSAFWKRYGNEALVSEKLNGVQKQAIFIRDNGDVLLGTDQGLAILKDGFWQWYAIDPTRRVLSSNVSYGDVGVESNILAITESDDGVLWLGTAKGVVSLEGGYNSELTFWNTAAPEGASSYANQVSAFGDRVLVGTSSGIYVIEANRNVATGMLLAQKSVSTMQLMDDFREPLVLANTNTGAYLMGLDSHKQYLIDGRVDQVTYHEETGELVWQKDRRFHRAGVTIGNDGLPALGEPELIGSDSDILVSRSVHHLSSWQVPGAGDSLVVTTDLGINVFNNGYFESMKLPFEERRGGLSVGPELSYVAANGDVALYTTDGVYLFMPSKVRQYDVGRVYDVVSHPGNAKTYVATGGQIAVFDPEKSQAGDLDYLLSANARVMSLTRDGALITHNGSQIIRVSVETGEAQRLFSARQSVDDEHWQGEVNDIYVDEAGVIWVAAGSSLFRYELGMSEPEEFNYLIDKERFPSKSRDIFRIYTNLDGKLHVVASPVHFEKDGVALSGGVMELRGDRFVNLSEENSLETREWFATGYTKISETTAIVGSNSHYQRERNGRRESFRSMNDPSYQDMESRSQMLWLGGEGAGLGEDTWLFPSAGGVMVYHNGQWFYPDKLNQLLPRDQELGQYGGRMVHAIDTDSFGNVFVGTDLGLLAYQSHGPESLLTDHGRGGFAFIEKDLSVQQEVKDLLLPGLENMDNSTGKLLAEYRLVNESIANLQSEPQQAVTLAPEQATQATQAEQQEEPQVSLEDARAEIARQEKRRELILANLERNNPALYQMLEVNPRSVAEMHQDMGPDEAIVQYLPTADKLLIQVVTDEGSQIREVSVKKVQLDREIAALVAQLDPSEGRGGSFRVKSFDPERMSTMDSEIYGRLSFLYEKLLRPVEREIEGKGNVYIIPVDTLGYVPFPALLRQSSPDPQYAVEMFNFGLLPSRYHYRLLHDYQEYLVEEDDIALLVADPLPGDSLLALPGSRKEVLGISELALTAQRSSLRKVILQGDRANLKEFGDNNDNARIIHIAAPMELKAESPDKSYLALSDARLSMVEISAMDLEKTDMVVLSASRSSQVAHGLEFTVLMKSFAIANVPTVIATKWKVDEDATRDFMEHFYRALAAGDKNRFQAIAVAQRSMLKETATAHPAVWSSFMAYGRP